MNNVPRMITVGKVKGKNQRNRLITIYNLSDNPSRFLIGNEVFCLGLSYTIVESSYKNAKEIALRLEPSPDLVLIGSELKVPYDSVPVLDKDTFYHEDLIGLKVFEFERFLGIITDIIERGSNDVYVVTNSDNEILIPGIKSVIKAVDIADQKMLVVLPKGL